MCLNPFIGPQKTRSLNQYLFRWSPADDGMQEINNREEVGMILLAVPADVIGMQRRSSERRRRFCKIFG